MERRQTYVLSGEEYQTHPHQPILALGLRLGPPDGLSSAWRWDWHDGCLVLVSVDSVRDLRFSTMVKAKVERKVST